MLRSAIESLEPRQLLSGSLTSAAKSKILGALDRREQGGFSAAGLEVSLTHQSSTATPDFVLLDSHPSLSKSGTLAPFGSPSPVGLSPFRVTHAYGINKITFGGVTGDGTGQSIAIVDAYDDPTAASDLHNFDVAFGLPDAPSFKKVNEDGGTSLPGVDPSGKGSSWAVEESLDIEWAHAIAPKANIILVEASSASDFDLIHSGVNWARHANGVVAISMSFGGGEDAGQTSEDSYFTTPSGHPGVTFLASTGDSGSPAGYPATSPNVVAVGGTQLNVDAQGNYQSESGWSGSGGGPSTIENQPSYQHALVGSLTSKRGTPDVAFDASPSSGVAIYDSYDFGTSTPWIAVGGTSLACPCWAGLIAITDQGRSINALASLDGVTGTLPQLYSMASSNFHDITSGNNGFSATTGYDFVTGRGTPIATRLVPLLAGEVPDAALHDTTTATTPTLTEGVSSGPLVVATFTDGNPGDHSAEMSAVIHWGDSNSSNGSITYDSGSGSYSVTGAHTYSDDGASPFAVTVDVSDPGTTGLSGVGQTAVTVNDAALTGSTGASVGHVVTVMPLGDSITYGFGSPGGYRDPLAHFLFASGYRYELVGAGGANSDDYLNAKADAQHNGVPGLTLSQMEESLNGPNPGYLGDQYANPGFWLSGQASSIQPDVILLLGGTNDIGLANLPASQALSNMSSLLSTIHAQSPNSQVVVGALPALGDSSYYNAQVQAFNAGLPNVVAAAGEWASLDTATALPPADLSPDGLPLSAQGYGDLAAAWWAGDGGVLASAPVIAGQGLEGAANSSVLSGATFTDGNPGDHSSDFAASIHWGDGSTSTGTVTYDPLGKLYTVNGAHTYMEEGGYAITIDVADAGGQATSITGSAVVADASLQDASTATTATATAGADSGPIAVAAFSDGQPGDNSAEMSALIHWGDGSTSTGVVTFDAQTEAYSVTGSHSYAVPSATAYPVTVDVSDQGASALLGIGRTSVAVGAAPITAGFRVGDGGPQRSMVTSLTLTFSAPVTLAAGAITVATTGGEAQPVQAATSDGATYLITLASASPDGSFPDGSYVLTVHADGVTGEAGQAMVADESFSFYRLFGDYTGGGTVNNADYLRFKAAYLSSAGSLAFIGAFDFDGNGTVNNADFLQFKSRYLTRVS